MIKRCIPDRIISVLLVFSILMSLISCSAEPPAPTVSNAEQQIITESIEVENIISKNDLREFITEEIYLQEIVVVEDKITELLLEEDTISEVLSCQTIFVPQDHIDDFAEHSQAKQLFGNKADLAPILKKLSIGTGVIVTLSVIKLVGIPEPISSIVTSAATSSLKSALNGAQRRTLIGGITGAAESLDETGRLLALLGFAQATVGLIKSVISFIGFIPSDGLSGLTLAEGVYLTIAGIKVIREAVDMMNAANYTIETFKVTDTSLIDWNNIDWEKAGVSTAEKAVKYGADGMMWGAVFGGVSGGYSGFKNYYRFNTPYTKYSDRIRQLKSIKSGIAEWTGEIGESDLVLNDSIELSDGTTIDKVTYKNGVPDFSPYAKAEVNISKMTNNRSSAGGNYEQADEALAVLWNREQHDNRTDWTSSDVRDFRENYPYRLTWHEMNNMTTMQLVPSDVNETFRHYGGVAEYNAMIGQEEAA